MKTIRVGDFDREIIIQGLTLVIDPVYGSETKIWSTFASVWAQYRPMTGNDEQLKALAARANELAIFTIRYLPGVLPTMRVQYGSKIYNIRSVNDTGLARQKVLEIFAEAEV